MKRTFMLIATSIFILSVTGCEKKTATALKNMEDIYEEQGIPVVTRELNPEEFSTYLTFTSSMKGIKESTGSSLISDTVEAVLVEVGNFVEKDQTIILFPKSTPAANYYQAEAGFKAAEQAFKRIENLYQSNGVSRQAYDDARTQYEVQLANWENVQDMVEVKAPLSGYITRLGVHPTDNVKPGDSLFTISNYNRLKSLIWVSDQEISLIHKGQRVFAEWEGIKITGKVTQVDLSKDSRMKAFAVYVEFGNSDHGVPSGITADINIETGWVEEALVLHRREILTVDDEMFVYLDRDGYAEKRTVTTGQRQGMYYQIDSGLEPGDKIITKGLSLVRDKSLIRSTEESVELVSK